MKILLLGNACLYSGFKELGHETLTYSPFHGGDIKLSQVPIKLEEILRALPTNWNADFILLTDDSSYPLILNLEHAEIPLLWYAIDSHIHHGWQKAYASVFDFVFVAQKDFVHQYVRDSFRQVVSWLPLFASSIPSTPPQIPPVHSLSFVGKLSPSLNPDRIRLLQSIQNRHPIYLGTGEWKTIFQQSKMVLNQCVANDVNFRTFEAMGCGSCLLMERVSNGLEELFQDRTHCVLYEKGNVDQLIDLVNYYEAHEIERESIASAGRAEILKAHMGIHRARAILQTFRSVDVQEMVIRRKACLKEIQFLLKSVYTYIASKYDEIAQESTYNTDKRHLQLVTRALYSVLSART